MKTQSLAGTWEFQQAGTSEWLKGNVPGGVHTDLMRLGRIQDPFTGDNEKRVAWVAEADWTYRREFICSPELAGLEKVFLVCEGLDTLARVELNGRLVGETNNMFRRYEWEIKPILRTDGRNEITIQFSSPVKYITEKQHQRYMLGPYHSIPGGPHLRKAPCQFGWDWGPKLPPVGIWKDIRLEGYSEARLAEVHLRQNHSDGMARVSARMAIEQWGTMALHTWLKVTAPDGMVVEQKAPMTSGKEGRIEIVIPNPELWWPNGYGQQPLYQVEVRLLCGEGGRAQVLDQRSYQLGLRTVELRQQSDKWGRSFEFAVNGVPIFAKGSNWIPADSFPTRISRQQLEGLIRSAVETHQNMLRVWGGGFYEDESFYDLCDRYGILVWQEFIFACSIYPLDDPQFVENLHIEAVENIRRLRHRTSLALWCGNNEMEEGWVEWGWQQPEMQGLKEAYDRFFHHTLEDWCLAEDPDHVYWPSSPSSGTPFENPNGQIQGDCHYWDVWHKRQPFTAYRKQFPRFMSEFGFQALPPLSTIGSYAEEKDWNMTAYIMEQHQKNSSGNALMVGQMLDTFLLPKDFDSLVYLSMVLQAEGIRYGVEHWRRNCERVAGTLYWQLNDCWPVASWSSLDYFGRWKALHYTARRFYAPVMLSIEDDPPVQSIYITNDLLKPGEWLVKWTLESLDGEVLDSGEASAHVAAQSAAAVSRLDFTDQLSEDQLRQVVFVAELWDGGQLVQRQTAFFEPIKHLELKSPKIMVNLQAINGQLVAVLSSQSLALLVEISLNQPEAVFSDNYFNLPAGREVRITCPLLEGWTLEKAKKEFRVRSVYDTTSHPADHQAS